MAAFTGTTTPTATRIRSSPKHFLTWSSAANNRLQKMSKHIVSKLQNKIHLHSSQQSGLNSQHHHHHHSHHHQHQQNENFQQNYNSSSDSNGGFPTDLDCISSVSSSCISVNGENNNNLSERGKKSRFSSLVRNKNHPQNHQQHYHHHHHNNNNSIISNNSSSSSANLIANMSAENILKSNEVLINNNSFLRDNNNQTTPAKKSVLPSASSSTTRSNAVTLNTRDSETSWKAKEAESSSSSSSSYRHRNRRKSSPLVKSLDLDLDIDSINNMLEMRPVTQGFYGGSMNISVLSDSKSSTGKSNGEVYRSNNNSSSSTISTAPTVPIVSPQWSRASSISIGSATQRDNHIIQSPPSTSLLSDIGIVSMRKSPNGINTNRITSISPNNLNEPNTEMRTSPSSTLSSSSSMFTPPVTISMAMTLPLTTKNPASSSSSSTPSTTTASSHFLSSFPPPPPNSNNKKSNSFENPTSQLNKQHQHHHHRHNHHQQQQQQQQKSNGTSSNSNSKATVTIFEEELRNAPWFQQGLPREIALEVLRNEPVGSFIVRESTTHEECFALSLRVPREFGGTGIAHYLILRTERGYKIKGFTKEFLSLTSLITHHSVMPELLPCPLALHRYSPHRVSRLSSIDFVELKPEKLRNFRKFVDF